MITKKTILILGAGANTHLGYPLGQNLIQDICRFPFAKSIGRLKKNTSAGTETLQTDADHAELLEIFLSQADIDKKFKFSRDNIMTFSKELFKAQPTSIDFFLEKNPQYAILGKLCIIFCLSKYEDDNSWLYAPWNSPEKFFVSFPEFGWYRYLWNKMIEGCEGRGTEGMENLKANKISILTFNYDRSLEHYLMRAITSFFNVSIEEAAGVFDSIKIKHVYGALGEFDWQRNRRVNSSADTGSFVESATQDTKPFRPWEISTFFRLKGDLRLSSLPGGTSNIYGVTKDDLIASPDDRQKQRTGLLNRFLKATEDIRLFHEVLSAKKHAEFYADIALAEKVYFLGFGYHSLNIKALGFSGERSSVGGKIFGTAIDLSTLEVLVKKHSFFNSPQNVDIRNDWIGLEKSDCKITSFFRHVAPLE